MTKLLPILLIAGTALITTAIVQAIYGLSWLWQCIFGNTVPSYNWSGSLSVSGIAIAVVLSACIVAQRLAARPEGSSEGSHVPAPGEAGSAEIRTAGKSE